MADPIADGGASQAGTYSLTFMAPKRAQVVSSDSPAYISADCEWMHRRSQICRDLRAGTAHLLTKSSTYLPQYPGEENEDYEMRLKFASLRNFYEQAVGSVLGKMFAQPPTLNDDVPEAMKQDLKDADLNGNHWSIVVEEFVDAALDEGISWLIVDYHALDQIANGRTLTLREEQEMGVRPYWVVVPQHRVLGYRYEHKDGRYVLTQFRFFTRTIVEDGEFGEREVDQITVYRPKTVENYIQDANGKWVLKDDVRPNTLGMVPVVHLNLKKRGQYLATPPLENLAYMNIEHFQVRSDQRRALAVASFPILASFGVEKSSGPVRIGPMTSLAFEDHQAKITWVESQGVHLKAGRQELIDLETQMRTFGLSFENPQMYATATGRNIDASDAVAPIIRWAFRMRDAVNTALWFHAKWRKVREGGTVDVNTTFLRNMITVEGLKLLLEALKAGKMTPKAFLERMKDYGLLSDDFDVESEVGDVEAAAEKAAQTAQSLIDSEGGSSGNSPPNPTS